MSLCLGFVLSAGWAQAAVFIVNSTADTVDALIGDGSCDDGGGACTLRAAIQEANFTAVLDTVNFNVPGTIVLTGDLPTVTRPIDINGTSQPGWAAGAPVVELNATLAVTSGVITLGGSSSGSTIRGLVINRSPRIAIRVLTSTNIIAGNFLGTDVAGTADLGNLLGIWIAGGSGNRVDGTTAAGRNVISGNNSDGIQIDGATSGNVVCGNYIGTTAAGDAPLGNTNQGVLLINATTNNVIGGTTAAERNVISGNGNDGILIALAGTTNNRVEGNRIGTNAAGTLPVANLRGIEISTSANGNTIGGAVAGAGNLISGNGSNGILINSSNSTTVQRNFVGTDLNGTAKVPNTAHGIQLIGTSSSNLIGGAGNGNVLSGNGQNGVDMIGNGVSANRVAANVIGLDVTGTAILGNTAFGLALGQGAHDNIIGEAGAGNVISGNGQAGVRIVDISTNNNLVQLNYIGLDASGTLGRANTAQGVIMDSGAGPATGNVIGGVGLGNVISGNGGAGIEIRRQITGTVVTANRIGTNAAGTAPVPNTSHGVYLASATTGHTIGGTGGASTRNQISGNGGQGVRIDGAGTINNVVEGNFIGTDVGGTAALANTSGGIAITNGAASNTVGGTAGGAGNVIAFNATYGINVSAGAGNGNGILGNSIYGNVAELGIDLAHEPGVTSNDLGDTDSGAANNLQNFPVLSAASTNTTDHIHIAGSLNSAAGTTYRIEFFSNTALVGADGSGFGEGQRYLDARSVTTDASGNAVIGVSLAAMVAAGEFVTATATDPSNNTSEFSAAIPAYASVIVTTTADAVDGTVTSVSALITNPGTDNRISLREAIRATNATAGTDTIRFGIPLTDAGHLYYKDDSTVSSLTTIQTATLADVLSPSSVEIPDLDLDYPTGLKRSWYRIRPTSALDTISQGVVLDATTQPGALTGGPVVVLDGTLAGGASNGLNLTAGPGTIKGLVIDNFGNDGINARGSGGFTITGNYIGTDASGTKGAGNGASGVFVTNLTGATLTQIGGSTVALRNVISGNGVGASAIKNGIYVYNYFAPVNTTQVRIQGNYIGTDVTGTNGLGVQERGVVLEYTGGHQIGGAAAGEGNLISGLAGAGIDLNGSNDTSGGGGAATDNNVIQGNFIGTNATATAAIPNSGAAIQMYALTNPGASASGNQVRGNVIAASGAGGDGIYVGGNCDNNVYDANFIGTDPTGTLSLGNARHGILIEPYPPSFDPTGNTISANVIRSNGGDGVRILGTSSVATLTQNSIHSNTGLGIDLNGDGVSQNDTGDVDPGPNTMLNFPGLPPAVETAGTLSVTFVLDEPVGFYRVEFFKNPVGADPTYHGEGQVYVASLIVNHPGGKQVYMTSFAGSAGEVVSATNTYCTDGAACAAPGSTSEFSTAWAAVTTAVTLQSFTATGGDQSVTLAWTTASELSNQGFNLYRSLAAGGPWTRITPSLIPGLGSSPIGASYSWVDRGLANGTRYYYQLEDVDLAALSTLHGPVSAVPGAVDEPGSDEGGDSGTPGAGAQSYGDPNGASLRVVSRSARRVVLELETTGFYAEPDGDGRVRLSVPGFELPSDPHELGLPFRRVLLDGEVGTGARLGAVRALDLVSYRELQPASVGYREMAIARDGTVRPARRRASTIEQRTDRRLARLAGEVFLGEQKKLVLELSPFRYLGRRLVLARRLRVEVVLEGRKEGETGRGRLGRRPRPSRTASGATLAFLYTSSAGLHAVPFESLGLGTRPLALSRLSLQRQGAAVPFHVEPTGASFGPRSVLYFVAAAEADSTAFSGELAYELVSGAPGASMPTAAAAPAGVPVNSSPQGVRRFERNSFYQPGYLEARDPWLWLAVPGGVQRTVSFSLDGALQSAPGELRLFLQGGSDAEGVVDHHLRILVNDVPVGEAAFDGKLPEQVTVSLPASLLREGANTLTLANVGDTGVYSLAFLDRFEVAYSQLASLRSGRFEGAWPGGGTATVQSVPPAAVVDVTDPLAPVWLTGYRLAPGALQLQVGASRRYLVAASDGLLAPRVAAATPSTLLDASNQADYLLITPAAFLSAAGPLVERRKAQGLRTRAVSLEEIAAAFGHGDSSGEAIRSFIAHAYSSWARPSPRYVLLLGDSSYDPRNFTGIAPPAPLPALWMRTSYLWTASDPTLAAVNGDDDFPDLALGRLPATTPAQARALVAKVLDWEDSRQGLDGVQVLVADNPDAAGDFEADVDDVRASFLAGRETTTIKLGELGSLTRPAILEAFDRGAAVVSYVGHGGSAVWASENVLNSWDATSLQAQSRQPLMLTFNCLNGYFVAPAFESLAEAFLKAEGRGTIAAYSPSGLSLDGPAHALHRAVMAALTSGRHARLGDAVLAAQQAYADAGLMPELVSIYHLFGDPALLIR